MADIRVLNQSTDVDETILEFAKSKEDYEMVMLLAIRKDGTQILDTSSGSMYQKCFLVAFMNAWIAKWFNLS